MNITDIAKIKQIADHYGMQSQQEMLIEECSELIQAMQKMKRADIADPEECNKCMQNLLEELADVTIMIEQMKCYLTPALLEDYNRDITQKLDRQLKRIENEKKEYERWREEVNV